jgi:outer membrane protein
MKKIVLFLMIFIVGQVYAQVSSKQIYSLDDCLKIAASQNYDVILSESSVTASGAQLTNAFGNYLPTINYNMGYSRILNIDDSQKYNIDGTTRNLNSYSMNAQAGLTLFDGFSREANYARSQHNLDANILTQHQTVLNVKLEVYKQYIEVVKASQIVKIRHEDFNQGQKELERIQAQYKAGVIAVNEVYAQEASLGIKEIDIVKSENVLLQSKAILFKIMGMNPDTDADFQESSIPTSVNDFQISDFRKDVGSTIAGYSIALKNRLDLQASNLNVKMSEASINMAKAAYMPVVSANGGWQWRNNEFSQFSLFGNSFIGMNLSFPILNNFSDNYQVENAKLQLSRSTIEKQKMELQIRTEVQSAFLDLDASEKQIDISKRSVKSSGLNYESVKERFRVGAASITDLTVANTQYITSQINSVSAIYDYIKAQRSVQFALGLVK